MMETPRAWTEIDGVKSDGVNVPLMETPHNVMVLMALLVETPPQRDGANGERVPVCNTPFGCNDVINSWCASAL